MSAIIKSRVAFLDRALLLKALQELQVNFHEQGTEIITHRIDYFGNQKFKQENGRYIFFFDRDTNNTGYGSRGPNVGKWPTTNAFLDELEQTYNRLYQEREAEIERRRKEEEERRARLERERLEAEERRRIEEELRRIEEERRQKEEELRQLEEQRKQYVESRKQEIIQKAQKQGYQVKEKQEGNKVKLVLVRHTY